MDRLWSQAARITARGRRAAIYCLHDVADAVWLGKFVDRAAAWRRVVGLDEIQRLHVTGDLRGDELALTFDDGLRSVIDVVQPTLAARDMPYTLFVNTAALAGGDPPWFVRLEALDDRRLMRRAADYWPGPFPHGGSRADLLAPLKELPFERLLDGLERAERELGGGPIDRPVLTAAEIADLSSDPRITIGSHTHRHPILAMLDLSEQRREIRTSLGILEELTGSRPTLFAYPNGTPLDFDARTLDILRESGIAAAVTTVCRPLRAGDDPLALPRITISAGEKPSRTAAKHGLPWVGVGMWRQNRQRRRIRAARANTVSGEAS